jgi:cell division protein FtsQ
VRAAAVAGRSLGGLRRLRLPAFSARLKRRLLAVAALCLLLAATYQFWFRDSWLVAVNRVSVSGLTTEDAPRVRSALTAAARSMTTLHLDRDDLERVVKAYPVVKSLELSPDFPHTLRIRVVEHHPAAIAVTDGGRVAVAADGTVLAGLAGEGRLPAITAEGTIRGERLEDPAALAAARVAGAAPAALHNRIETVRMRKDQGLVVLLRDGPDLIFGDAVNTRAKWMAAARVLADKTAAGATYIDLRLPGRPAAGGLPAETVTPVAPAGTTGYTTPDAAAQAAGAAATGVPSTGAPTAAAQGAQTTTPTVPPVQPDAAAGATGTAPVSPQTTPPATDPQAPATAVPGSEGTGSGAVAAPSP